MDCIFCNVRDTAKESFIYQDDEVFVVPDRFPSAKGHVLVITKKHVKDMLESDDATIGSAFSIAKKVAIMQREKLGADSMRISTNIGKGAGQIIFHFHIHVLPIYSKEPDGFSRHKEITASEAKRLVELLKF
ncbi:MAG: HIT family protein [Candidatus Micrarchaeota archaeon]|nr:HIT family protein [Candidatus Micrarchaeota archaeon]